MARQEDIEQEIRDALGDTIQYDLNKMFPERQGLLSRGRVRRKLKLLKKLMPALSSVVVEGEKMVYVARGCIMHWWEQLFAGGLVAYYTNITCVVLTDRRVIFINTDSAGKQKHFRNQVLYTEIAAVKMRSSATKLKFKDGKTLAISGFKGADRKYMQLYIPEIISTMPKEAPRVERSIQYLCPHCPTIYTGLLNVCRNCGTMFKSPRKAALMSLFLPGLGDLYLGHTVFGVIELLGSLVEWLVLVGVIASVISREEGSIGLLVTWIVIMTFTNVVDYFLTGAMGRKGLIAASRVRGT